MMANPKHLAILRQGHEAWNAWRAETKKRPDLRGCDLKAVVLTQVNLGGACLCEADIREGDLTQANLRGANLERANLKGTIFTQADLTAAGLKEARLTRANLTRANLTEANLTEADLVLATLKEANLRSADLTRANLWGADASGADLREAILLDANLTGASLAKADLTGASLERAVCVDTSFEGADLTDCRVYGLSAWDVNLADTKQVNLVITRRAEAQVSVDNLEVAQFIYLLLNNERIRDVIDTIGKKVVLILGRFTPERKVVLDALRDALRARNYLPVVFDFEKPVSRDLTETVRTLAGLARFVVADITDAKSIPQELMAVVPNMPSVPVQPLLLSSQNEYAMFEHFRRYPWVLREVLYETPEHLLGNLDALVIAPAEAKAEEMKPPVRARA